MLAMVCHKGFGVWLEMAASVGHCSAQNMLAAFLLEDEAASKKDEVMAVKWFTLLLPRGVLMQ